MRPFFSTARRCAHWTTELQIGMVKCNRSRERFMGAYTIPLFRNLNVFLPRQRRNEKKVEPVFMYATLSMRIVVVYLSGSFQSAFGIMVKQWPIAALRSVELAFYSLEMPDFLNAELVADFWAKIPCYQCWSIVCPASTGEFSTCAGQLRWKRCLAVESALIAAEKQAKEQKKRDQNSFLS